jgi:hypothetical protein
MTDAEKDTARLDWLETHPFSLPFGAVITRALLDHVMAQSQPPPAPIVHASPVFARHALTSVDHATAPESMSMSTASHAVTSDARPATHAMSAKPRSERFRASISPCSALR